MKKRGEKPIPKFLIIPHTRQESPICFVPLFFVYRKYGIIANGAPQRRGEAPGVFMAIVPQGPMDKAWASAL